MTNITEKNMDAMNPYTKTMAIKDANHLIRSSFAGDLATLGRVGGKVEGYPFGSVSPFMLDHTGNPVIQIASMAEHSKNIVDNGKASLMIRQVSRQHYIETGWRLTMIGDVTEVASNEVDRISKAYYRYYKEAEQYNNVHHFKFYRLNIKAIRIIMGFGKIAWVNPNDVVTATPFSEHEEHDMIEHMNHDHIQTIKRYLTHLLDVTLNVHKKSEPHMVAINQFGITINYLHRLYFLPFNQPANTTHEVRKQLVALAKQ